MASSDYQKAYYENPLNKAIKIERAKQYLIDNPDKAAEYRKKAKLSQQLTEKQVCPVCLGKPIKITSMDKHNRSRKHLRKLNPPLVIEIEDSDFDFDKCDIKQRHIGCSCGERILADKMDEHMASKKHKIIVLAMKLKQQKLKAAALKTAEKYEDSSSEEGSNKEDSSDISDYTDEEDSDTHSSDSDISDGDDLKYGVI